MSKLLIDNALSSEMKPEVKDAWANVARVWTLTLLRRVNGERKGIVLRFLYESNLIQGSDPIVSLVEADLIGADLRGANLRGANLAEACLEGAGIEGSNLSGADLRGAILAEACLEWTDLSGADLSGAALREALYNKKTVWPDGFDPVQAGAILVKWPDGFYSAQT